MKPNFFPRVSNSTRPNVKRVSMTLSDKELRDIPRGYWVKEVTDLATGFTVTVKGAECSLEGCMCDAQIANSSLHQINRKYEIVE